MKQALDNMLKGESDSATISCWFPVMIFLLTCICYLQALNNMLEDKAVARPLNIVAHGFITGQVCRA